MMRLTFFAASTHRISNQPRIEFPIALKEPASGLSSIQNIKTGLMHSNLRYYGFLVNQDVERPYSHHFSSTNYKHVFLILQFAISSATTISSDKEALKLFFEESFTNFSVATKCC